MSFLFAAVCTVRRSGLVKGAWAFHRYQRTLIITLSDGAGIFLTLSDHGTADATVPLPTPPRPSLVAIPMTRSEQATRFLLCDGLPTGYASAGAFLPASGEVTFNWRGGQPTFKARFVANLDLSMSRAAGPARWRISGARIPWRGEMTPKQGVWSQ